jgi:hypothetical protein
MAYRRNTVNLGMTFYQTIIAVCEGKVRLVAIVIYTLLTKTLSLLAAVLGDSSAYTLEQESGLLG